MLFGVWSHPDWLALLASVAAVLAISPGFRRTLGRPMSQLLNKIQRGNYERRNRYSIPHPICKHGRFTSDAHEDRREPIGGEGL